jgi:hypothetical protein
MAKINGYLKPRFYSIMNRKGDMNVQSHGGNWDCDEMR